jgi:hypothetical protein
MTDEGPRSVSEVDRSPSCCNTMNAGDNEAGDRSRRAADLAVAGCFFAGDSSSVWRVVKLVEVVFQPSLLFPRATRPALAILVFLPLHSFPTPFSPSRLAASSSVLLTGRVRSAGRAAANQPAELIVVRPVRGRCTTLTPILRRAGDPAARKPTARNSKTRLGNLGNDKNGMMQKVNSR